PSSFSAVLADQDGKPITNATVTFSIDGGAPQSATTDDTGEASVTPDGLLAPGVHSVAVSFDGTGGDGAATTAATPADVKADQTISFGPLADATYGDPDFDVSASASSGLDVSFSGSGACTVTGSTVHITGAGGCTVTASQAGNDDYNAAPDAVQSFTVAR